MLHPPRPPSCEPAAAARRRGSSKAGSPPARVLVLLRLRSSLRSGRCPRRRATTKRTQRLFGVHTEGIRARVARAGRGRPPHQLKTTAGGYHQMPSSSWRGLVLTADWPLTGALTRPAAQFTHLRLRACGHIGACELCRRVSQPVQPAGTLAHLQVTAVIGIRLRDARGVRVGIAAAVPAHHMRPGSVAGKRQPVACLLAEVLSPPTCPYRSSPVEVRCFAHRSHRQFIFKFQFAN